MNYDINWLLSSVAQASAAMIAIVGGLLVTRYVGLHAEQQAAGRRLSELRARSKSARSQLEADRLEARTVNAADIVDSESVFAAIVDADLDLPVNNVFNITGVDAVDYDEALVQGQLDAVAAQIRDALLTLLPLVPEATDHDHWSDFRSAHPDLPVGHRHVWEWAYDEVCRARRDEAVASLSPSQERIFSAQQIYRTPDFKPPRIRYDTQQVRDRLTARIESAEAVVRESDREAVLAERAYEALRQPEGFTLALRVLLTLAVSGVLPPVILMATGASWWHPWLPLAVAASFFFGLSTLLRFLFVYANFLHRGGRAELPSRVSGLFMRGGKATE